MAETSSRFMPLGKTRSSRHRWRHGDSRQAGSKLVFQMHYTPNGTPQRDRSYVGFRFADPAKVTREARSAAVVNQSFAIPAGADNYEASAERTFEHDALITNLMPHMHTRGKSFRYEATYPNGKHEVLLDVPAYDFNWQTTYYLAEPKLRAQGNQATLHGPLGQLGRQPVEPRRLEGCHLG